MGKIFVGMAGWSYEGWRGSFYPDDLKQKDELAHASRRIHTIEVNGTFYSLFRPNSYLSWYAETPADFNFSLKGPKYITHERRLKDFQTPLSNFLASGILALRDKLGCILWQFPPNMPFTRERFEPFLAALPHDMKAAAVMGQGHSTWLEGRTFLDVQENHRLRHAFEGRHPSFRDPVFVELAKHYGVAIVVGDTAGRWPLIEDVTSDFMYLRLHADETKYPDGYTKDSLEYWGKRITCWSKGTQPDDAALVVRAQPALEPRTVFAYFDNDVKETAPLNALSMITHLQQDGLLPERKPDDWKPSARIKKVAKVKKATAVKKPKSAKKAKVVKKTKAKARKKSA